MTSALAIQPTTRPNITERRSEHTPQANVVADQTTEDAGVGATLRVVLPSTVIAVLLVVTVAFAAGGTPIGEAVAYGFYLAFWIGGGFGAILSGAVWSSKHMEH